MPHAVPDLSAVLAEHALRHRVPGAALAVVRGDDVAVVVHGVRDVLTREPVTPATRFEGGSLTKVLVATLAQRLADEGRLDLHGPIAERVPELRGAPWAATASLDDILAGLSGLPLRAETDFDAPFDGPDAIDRMLEAITSGASSRASWSYSNASWSVVARAIEHATTLPWRQAMQSYVLEPAGMSATSLEPQPPAGLAVGHQVRAGEPVPVAADRRAAYAASGTTLTTTAGDLARLARLHLADPRLAALRSERHARGIHAWFDAWCRGLARFDWEGGTAFGWSGVTNGCRAEWRFLPERQGAIALLANASTGRAAFRSLLDDVAEPLFGARPSPLRLAPRGDPGLDLGAYVGRYAWPDQVYEVALSEQGLTLVVAGRASPLVPLDRRTFLLNQGANPDVPTVTFDEFDASGRPGVLYVMLWAYPRSAEAASARRDARAAPP